MENKMQTGLAAKLFIALLLLVLLPLYLVTVYVQGSYEAYFREEHIGADKYSGLVHTVQVTAANVSDVSAP